MHDSSNKEAATLGAEIVTSQTAEIADMKKNLASL
jgi:uncharacterized protein (DUF305 family)